MKRPSGRKLLKHYRFSPAMIDALARESKRTHRTQTKILELAFASHMAFKAEQRDRLIVT